MNQKFRLNLSGAAILPIAIALATPAYGQVADVPAETEAEREARLTTRRRGLLFWAHSRISWAEVGRRRAGNRASEKRARQQALRQRKGRMKAHATKARERRPMVMHVVVSRQ